MKLTLDSLANTVYESSHKLLFIVADGIVKGENEVKTTPDLILDLMQLDIKFNHPPMPQQYESLG